MMENIIVLSNQGFKNLDSIEVEMKNKYKTVIQIDLSNNYLSDFNTKYSFPLLQVLVLDHNQLSTIKNFPIIKNLETLSINNNLFTSALEFSMYSIEKFPNLKLINTMGNPMNPGLENIEDYKNYRIIIQKIKNLKILDGLDINDLDSLISYNDKKSRRNLFTQEKLESISEETDESELYSILKQKKRQSTITYSQRMLKKADNLTKFNRKNHSEGNKHITNNDL